MYELVDVSKYNNIWGYINKLSSINQDNIEENFNCIQKLEKRIEKLEEIIHIITIANYNHYGELKNDIRIDKSLLTDD